jgi:hypothetical protein
MDHLEQAISKHSKKQVVLKYNLCMTKLQAANCVLQKLTRNIPRTVEEVEEALTGLQESLEVVEDLLKRKTSQQKIPINTSTLQNFLTHCRANITSAESHLEDEKKRRADAEAEREIRQLAADASLKEASLREAIKKADDAKEQDLRDKKADEKMMKVDQLRANWQHDQEVQQNEKDKKARKTRAGGVAPGNEDFLVPDDGGQAQANAGHGLFDDSSDEEDDEPEAKRGEDDRNKKKPAEKADAIKPSQSDLFGDSDEDEEMLEDTKTSPKKVAKPAATSTQQDLFGDSDDDDDDDGPPTQDAKAPSKTKEEKATDQADAPSNQDLFGDSDEESDEELVRPDANKRDSEDNDDEGPRKKRRVLQEEED